MSNAGFEALRLWKEQNQDWVKHPTQPRNPAQRWRDKDTMRNAIHAMCWQCMGGSENIANNAMDSIRNCTSDGREGYLKCPLHGWRPYK